MRALAARRQAVIVGGVLHLGVVVVVVISDYQRK